jgi:formate hydrogenlyase subunit 6/NADH:ubiquinone oxidoreductase subunit I
VFDTVPDAPPTIARQSDCQTCYICELYCPVDALYVAPESDVNSSINEVELVEKGLLGSYRENIGWGAGRETTAKTDQTFQLLKHLN